MVTMRRSRDIDRGRPPLRERVLSEALIVPGGLWTDVRVVTETGSTNADVVAAAGCGAAEGLVVLAERQSAGRGRLGRHWHAPSRAAITASILLRPGVSVTRLGWLPLLAGVALVETVAAIAEVDAALKWPNDLLVRGNPLRGGAEPVYGKCAGILAEVVNGGEHPAVVLGIGLNVTQRADELPGLDSPTAFPATSLLLAGAGSTDRDRLLRGFLDGLSRWYWRWLAAGGDAEACGLRQAYRSLCHTLGRDVSVRAPDGDELRGLASDVDAGGRLVIATAHGLRALAAGDVQHVR